MRTSKIDETLPKTLGAFVWRYLRHKKWCLVGFFFIALIFAIEMSLSPYLLKVIIDRVVQHANDPSRLIHVIMLPVGIYASMSVILNLTFRLYDYINLRLYPYLKSEIDKDMFAYVLNHSYTFFQNNFAGSITKKLADMAINIEPLVNIPNQWFYPRVISSLIASATLFTVVHPLFGIILFVWALVFVYLSYIAAKGSERYARSFAESISKMDGTISDTISNVMSTKLFDNISHQISHASKNITHVVKKDRDLQWYNLKVNFIQGIGVTVLMVSMLAALVYGIQQHWVSPGDFALVLMLSIFFMWNVHDVGKEMQRFSKVVGTCNQALDLIRIPHEIMDMPDAFPLVVTKGEIKFDHVSFYYENNKPLFTDLSIKINPGEKVGLVGYSGGGKSTFIKLILRLIDTQSGDILIDNQPIKHITQGSLRRQIGTIPQEPELFHRTIMENIKFAKPEASDTEVIEASKKARCHEFIMELPEQYHSLVGERGIKLSGGQKQRIAIARAFLKNAPILILDEATSSLDSVTERYIHEALHQVMTNKTTIVIAHRLATLKDMDRILVFVDGKITEDGSLNALLKKKRSHFYKLWHMQAEGFLPSIAE